MKKFVFSMVRTALGAMIMVASVILVSKAMSWELWAPNNDWGFLIVSTMYLLGVGGFGYGGYMLSPIFWKTLSYAFLANILTGKDYDNNYYETRKEIRRLRKWFVW